MLQHLLREEELKERMPPGAIPRLGSLSATLRTAAVGRPGSPELFGDVAAAPADIGNNLAAGAATELIAGLVCHPLRQLPRQNLPSSNRNCLPTVQRDSKDCPALVLVRLPLYDPHPWQE